MSIIRAPRPQGNFYILNKRISEDRRLTWAARGLLVYLLGKPDNWNVSTAALINETTDARVPSGRDAIRALVGELMAAGYMTRSVARDEGGKVVGYDYTVSEDGFTDAPETDYPAPVKPSPVRPAPANPPLTRTESITSIDTATSIDSAFELFWSAGMVKTGKKPALAKFKTLVKRLHADPAEFALRLASDVRARIAAKQYGFDKLHPVTYLNQERWEDEAPRAPASTHTNFKDRKYVGTDDAEIDWLNSPGGDGAAQAG